MAWDIASGKSFRTINVGFAVYSLAQTNDPRSIYVAGSAPQIRVYNLTNNQVAKTFDGHGDVVNVIAISPNNKLLLSGSSDKTARIWDITTGKQIRALPVNCWKVTAVAFSEDSKYAVTGCNDGSMKVWEVESGKLLTEIEGKDNSMKDVAFTKNAKQILAAAMLKEGNDYGLRIWPSGIEPPAIKTITIGKDSLKLKTDTLKGKNMNGLKPLPSIPVKK
jgi:WD40 repeat protein